MDKERFEKAIALNQTLEKFKKHREAVISSNMQYGGSLIFHYNDHKQDVNLIGELYGDKHFFSKYLENLDAKISEIEKEFSEL